MTTKVEPAHFPLCGFSSSLLALVNGAAAGKKEKERGQAVKRSESTPLQGKEHDPNSKSPSLEEKQVSDVASDMVTHSHFSSSSSSSTFSEIENIRNRSNYTSSQESSPSSGQEGRQEAAGQQHKDGDDSIFGHEAERKSKMTSEFRLSLFLHEFGESGLEGLLGAKEEYITDVTAYYVDQVIVKGCALLTTHRFFFVAYLPKAVETTSSSLSPSHSKDVAILSGPGYFHRKATKTRRHVWFELQKDSLVGYPKSDRLYEPLGSVRIAHIKNLKPHQENSKEVHFEMHGNECWLELGTKEAAETWHKELSALLWHLKHSMDTLRIAVPLVRVSKLSFSTFVDFSQIFIFEVDRSTNRGILAGVGDKVGESSSNNKFQLGVHLAISEEMKTRLEEQLERVNGWKEKNAEVWDKVPQAVILVEDPSNELEQVSSPSHATKSIEGVSDEKQIKLKEFMKREFALASKLEDMHAFKADVVHALPTGGTLVFAPDCLCFFGKNFLRTSPSIHTKIPMSDIKAIQTSHAFRWHWFGIRLTIEAHADIVFELHDRDQRDRLVSLIYQAINPESPPASNVPELTKEMAGLHGLEGGAQALAELLSQNITVPQHILHKMRKVINVDLHAHIKLPPMKIACLTIGSRGDVQPYIALCKALTEHGHDCVIVSHPEYKEWVNRNGIAFRPAGGDPGLLMKLSVENKMFSPTFFKETLGKFRFWLDELLREIMEQCYDVELIIESPSTFGGIHVAEALEIGYMRAFTMPWTKTSAYPQAFSVPSVDLGGGYNTMSYEVYEQIIWMASEGQINRWRRNMLVLDPTNLASLDIEHIPFMYNFSPAVVPHPLDWGNSKVVTGYWNLASTAEEWSAPHDLVAFLQEAQKKEKKVAYIGFGSITIPNAHKTMQTIFDAAQKSGVYCIVSKGWSDRMEGNGSADVAKREPWKIPKEVYLVDSIPHDWLFPRINIAMHHGGAGTTGASLTNGLVTLIHPFFGDQFFWAGRVEKLGAGKKVATLGINDVSHALENAANDRLMREKAARIGKLIKTDRGVEAARSFIYHHYESSKRTARRPKTKHATRSMSEYSISLCGSDGQKTKSSASPTAERQDSGVVLSLVESPQPMTIGKGGFEGGVVLNEAKEGESITTDQNGTGSYSSKQAKLEDVKRRASLLARCKTEGKVKILHTLDPMCEQEQEQKV